MTTTPAESFEEVLNGMVSEVLELRYRTGTGSTLGYSSSEFGPHQVLESLQNVRGRLDRLEEILSRLTRIRAEASRRSEIAQTEAQDAWDLLVLESTDVDSSRHQSHHIKRNYV